MRVSYFHTPERVPSGSMAAAAVVIDVLRATSTMAWALHNGAEAVQAFADLDELNAAAAAWPQQLCLRAGERGGSRLEGFDLGNSPLAVTAEIVAGKRIFVSTTNGTRALDRVQTAPLLVTAALVNRSAVAKRLLQQAPESVWVVGSGWEGDYSLEDSLAAGALAAALLGQGGMDLKTIAMSTAFQIPANQTAMVTAFQIPVKYWMVQRIKIKTAFLIIASMPEETLISTVA